MKKLFVFTGIFILALQSKAQFFNSVALTVGGSAGNQKFFFHDPDAFSRKKYILGLNASFFGEFFSHDYARWVSEIQYNQKGSIDRQPEDRYRNRLHYLSWNNYLKLRYELYSVIPYVLVGPRLDYNLIQSTSSPVITGPFQKLHVSAAAGAGVEFISYSNWKFFVEGFYNPDIMKAYSRPGLHIKNKNLELRVGLKYEFGERETCNTPTYVE